MRYLADDTTPSQHTFPTKRTLVFVLCQPETGVRITISLLLSMGAHFLVPLLLCRPSVAPFLEAVALSLDIPIIIY